MPQIDPYRFLIPKENHPGMRIDAMIYTTVSLFESLKKDDTLNQVINVAKLPGMVHRSLAMPDAHQGYGFCIGGVAAASLDSGVVSAGGVGFDINCGVRLLRSDLNHSDITKDVKSLANAIFHSVPSGLGKGRGKGWSFNKLKLAVLDGAGFAVNEGFGHKTDLDFIEDRGRISTVNTETISRHAYDRGAAQLGTLGSGNHFIEIQHVDQIFEPEVAKAFGLRKGQVVILIHTGSRGFGHQVCTDHLQMMKKAMVKYQIHVEDRQLACVPIDSKEGEDYLSAMAGAANFAFANRQFITHYVRQAFNSVMGKANIDMVYDVAHNIAKKEDHLIEGKKQPVLVHRKGATRAFPKGHKDLPIAYQSVGQPVLIPGSMGTASYVLVGKELAMQETFGSVCHGAGRVMSRKASKKSTTAEEVVQRLQNKGILIQSASKAGITEEQPEAYKDVDEVVSIVHNAGLASMVARLKPIAVIKG